jgi:hypothetical protein
MKTDRSTNPLVFFALSIPTLLFPAFLLGYPIVYQDTIAYVHGGFIDLINGMNFDVRSPFYSYFLRLTSFDQSVWSAVAVQAALACAALRMAFQSAAGSRSAALNWAFVLTVSLFSTLPWFACLLTPDIFTGVIPLFLFVLLTGEGLAAKAFIPLILSGIMHNSHIPIMLLSTALLAPCLAVLDKRLAARLLRGAAAILLMAAALSAAGFIRTGKARMSETGAAVFLANRWFADGILQPYLRQRCMEGASFTACAHLDGLPVREEELLWGDTPYMRALGGFSQAKPELSRICAQFALDHPGQVLASAWNNSIRQLLLVGVPLWSFDSSSDGWRHALFFGIFPKDRASFEASMIHSEEARMAVDAFLSATNPIAALAALAALAAMSGLGAWRRPGAVLFLVCVAWHLSNVFVCASLSGPFQRFAGRTSWCVLAASLAVLAGLFIHRAGLSPRWRKPS